MCNVKVDLQYYYVCTIKRGNSYIEDDLYTQGKFSLRFAEGLIIFFKPIVCPVSRTLLVKTKKRNTKRM